jgi:hypothetical protein
MWGMVREQVVRYPTACCGCGKGQGITEVQWVLSSLERVYAEFQVAMDVTEMNQSANGGKCVFFRLGGVASHWNRVSTFS